MKCIRTTAAAMAALFIWASGVLAAPANISYQGTLRKDGRLYSGTAAMEFRITDSAGATEYWTSGSTDVVVSTGLFRYPIGSPNTTQFGNIVWKDIVPYVQMKLDGTWLPPEPLYASAYALHAVTAESSTGAFTVNGGSFILNGSDGTDGIVFPGGTVQYAAPGWALAASGLYTSFQGWAAVGRSVPSYGLDVQAGSGDAYVQLWRNGAGTIVASMTATGVLYADASGFSNMPAGTLSGILASGNNAGGANMVNVGSITVSSQLGVSAPRLALAGGVELSSAAQGNYGGAQFSSHVYLVSGAVYYGDGSGLTSLSASGISGGTLPDARLSSNVPLLDAANNFTGSIAVPAVRLAPAVSISSAPGSEYGGVSVSSHVYLAAGAKYYGDGSALSNLQGDGLGSHTATQTLAMGGYDITGAYLVTLSSITSAGSSVVISTNLYVNGAVNSSSLSGAGEDRCVYADTTGKLQLAGGACGTVAGNDNMGNHTATQNIRLSGYWLSNDGDSEGVYVNAAGLVGVGSGSPAYGLDVAGSFRVSNSSMVAQSADTSGTSLHAYNTSAGGRNWALVSAGSADANPGRFYVSDQGTTVMTFVTGGSVGIRNNSPQAALDVTGTGTGPASFVQAWRDSSSVIVGSMSANGVMMASRFIGDGSGLSNLAGDSLGSHTASQSLDLASFDIVRVSSINFLAGVFVTSAPAASYGGLYVSSHVYLPAGAVYYGDGSGLTALSASNVSAGTLADARLSANVPLLNAVNTFSSSQTVTGADGLWTARVALAGGVEFSSAAAGNYGGVQFSSHVFLVPGAAYYGDGSGLASLSATNVSAGTLADARLSSNVPLLNTANTFSSSQTVTGEEGLSAAAVQLAQGVRLSSAPASAYGGFYASSHVYLAAGAKYYGDASALSNVPGDDLGGHALTQNLVTGSNWISGDGGNEGIYISADGNVGVGTNAGAVRLEVDDDDGSVFTSGIRFTNFRCSDYNKLTVDASGNLICATDQTGSGSGNLIDTLEETLNAGANAGTLGMVNLGDVAIGSALAGTRLDVQGSGGGYTQFWRNSSGVIVASMTETGVLYADGSGMTGLPTNDNLGSHTATQNLDLSSFSIIGVSSVNFRSNVFVATATAANYGGFHISSHVYLPAGATYYGDGSGLTALSASNVSAGTLPDARLSSNVPLQSSVNTFSSSQTVTAAGGIAAPGLQFSPSVRVSSAAAAEYGGLRVSSHVYLPAGAKYYGDGSQLTGITGAADNMGTHIATKTLAMSGFDIAGVSAITYASNVYISTAAGYEYGGLYVSSHVYLAAGAKYYGDGSALSNMQGDGLGSHAATQTLTMGGYDISGAYLVTLSSINTTAESVVISTNVYVNGAVKSSSLSNFGNRCVYANNSGQLLLAGDACGTVAGNDNLGNHTMTQNLLLGAYWLSGDGDSEGLTVDASGNVGAGRASAGTRLDVQAGADGYAQFWRDSGGVIVASMSSAGLLMADRFVGDGSGLTGTGLGSHLASQDLDLSSYSLVTVSSVTMFGQGIAIATGTGAGASGLFISTAGSIMTAGLGNGSAHPGTRGIGAVDLQTSRSNAAQVAAGGYSVIGGGSQNQTMPGNNWQVIAGGNNNVANAGYASILGGYNNNASGYYSSILGGAYNSAAGNASLAAGSGSSSTAAGAFTWADSEGIAGLTLTLNTVADRTLFKNRGGFLVTGSTDTDMTGAANRGVFITGNGLVGISTGVPGAALDVVSAGDTANTSAQIWRNASGSIVASMTATGVLYTGALGTSDPILVIGTHVYVGGGAGFGNDIAAPSTYSVVSVYHSFAGDSNENNGLDVYSELAPASNGTGAFTTGGSFAASLADGDVHDSGLVRGLYSMARAWNSNSLMYAAGIMSGVSKRNNGVLGAAYGGYFSVRAEDAAAAGNIANAYGVYAMNYVAHPNAGITNNYGVYVDSAAAGSLNLMTNNYGLYINDQSGIGTSSSYNLYSAGASAKNHFAGEVSVGARLTLPSKVMADLLALTPSAEGEIYYCSDCSPKKVVVSTGTSAGNFAAIDGGTFE